MQQKQKSKKVWGWRKLSHTVCTRSISNFETGIGGECEGEGVRDGGRAAGAAARLLVLIRRTGDTRVCSRARLGVAAGARRAPRAARPQWTPSWTRRTCGASARAHRRRTAARRATSMASSARWSAPLSRLWACRSAAPHERLPPGVRRRVRAASRSGRTASSMHVGRLTPAHVANPLRACLILLPLAPHLLLPSCGRSCGSCTTCAKMNDWKRRWRRMPCASIIVKHPWPRRGRREAAIPSGFPSQVRQPIIARKWQRLIPKGPSTALNATSTVHNLSTR